MDIGSNMRFGLFFIFIMVALWMVAFPISCLSDTQDQQLTVPSKKIFSMENATNKAREMAKRPFQNPFGRIPNFLLELNYDQWRDIRFKPENSLWRLEKLPFEVQFFHPGFYYNIPVIINTISASKLEIVPFSSNFFDYGANDFKSQLPDNLEFAGFRIHHHINTKTYKDEVVVFLGASYFRAVAKGQVYGLSARGIAIDTGLSSGEEFPFFKEFWIVKPGPHDINITLYALLDSPSLTGAYCYRITPGRETTMDVSCTLFLRKEVKKIGIAPLTSMFFYGENTNIRPRDDFRPEVHDSDGLQLAFKSGEFLWRPLLNPKTLWINSLRADNILGFGLIQRDLNFDHYQDSETHYESRPSVWITPKSYWGKGNVELIQIPTESDIHDNIVAMWVPERVIPAEETLSFDYTMKWHFPNQAPPPRGRVMATRTATTDDQNTRMFLIDFAGAELETIGADEGVEGVITVPSGCRLLEQHVIRNNATGQWRLVFKIQADESESLVERVLPERRQVFELRAFLRRGENVLTETWSYGDRL